MKFSKMMKSLHSVAYDAVRLVASERLEAVLSQEGLRDVLPILGKYFGAPLKPSEQSPSAEVSRIAKSLGGIREGQTLYCSEAQEKREVAVLWPWADGTHVTLKVTTEPRMDSECQTWEGKEPFAPERFELHAKDLGVLVLGSQEPWTGDTKAILNQGGFNVQSEFQGAGLAGRFEQRDYFPNAVLVHLSTGAGWPGVEVLHQIKAYWPQTKLIVFAEEDVPSPVSLEAIRNADRFHRCREDWSLMGEWVKKELKMGSCPS